jgi:hypothetical protein
VAAAAVRALARNAPAIRATGSRVVTDAGP